MVSSKDNSLFAWLFAMAVLAGSLGVCPFGRPLIWLMRPVAGKDSLSDTIGGWRAGASVSDTHSPPQRLVTATSAAGSERRVGSGATLTTPAAAFEPTSKQADSEGCR